MASDFNSADGSTVNVGSGRLQSDISAGKGSETLRGPATGESDVRVSGEEWKTNTAGSGGGREGQDQLGGLPNDALTREAKDKKEGVVDTTGKDYGYPQKSDPSSGLK